MRTEELVTKTGRAGSNGSWRSYHSADGEGGPTFAHEIWHYSTLMLAWNLDADGTVSNIWTSTGHGSVSDQQAMNRFFRALNVNLYFSRQGGASIDTV